MELQQMPTSSFANAQKIALLRAFQDFESGMKDLDWPESFHNGILEAIGPSTIGLDSGPQTS